MTAEQRGKVVEKIFSKGIWIDAPDATNIIDENGYYTRMDALSSIQYASTDLLDTNNKVVFDSRYKYNSAIYKVAGMCRQTACVCSFRTFLEKLSKWLPG